MVAREARRAEMRRHRGRLSAASRPHLPRPHHLAPPLGYGLTEMKGKNSSATGSPCHGSPRTAAQCLAKKCTCRSQHGGTRPREPRERGRESWPKCLPQPDDHVERRRQQRPPRVDWEGGREAAVETTRRWGSKQWREAAGAEEGGRGSSGT